MKISAVSQLAHKKFTRRVTCEKGHMRSTCWKLKSQVPAAFRECFARRAILLGIHEMLCLEDFKCDFLTLHPYYIYTHYPQKQKRYSERKPLDRFSTTQHTHLKRESYSSLVRYHCILFSFPLPLSNLKRRFVSKHNPQLFKVQRVFWSLGSFGDLPKGTSEAWRMQSGVFRDLKSQRRHDLEKFVGSKSLMSSSTLGRPGLEGLCCSCTPTLFSNGSIST